MFMRSVPLALLAAVQSTTSLAAEVNPRHYRFDIPAGSLDDALKRYARITGRQILYRAPTVAQRRFAGLFASLDADAALTRILDGTALRVTRPAPNVIVIEQEATGALADSVSGDGGADIIVTGSNIRGANPTTSVRTISRREIERSGKATIGEAIAALPANFGGTGNPVAALTGADRASLNYSVATGANLRGLGSDATLTLFDGRRVAGSGGRGDFADLSAIPSMAVERVEILADGASAIYGSDAVGGVVNIVLRHRLSGLEARLRGGTTTDGATRHAIGGLVAGHDWGSGGILLAYEYEHRDQLAAADRTYAATGDLRGRGGTDHRTFYSAPATILSFTPAAGTFVPAYRVQSVPGGAAATLDQIVPGQNLYNPIKGLDLAPRIDRHAVYGHVEQRLGSHVTGFFDARYAHRDIFYRSPASVAAFAVTAANPYFLPVGGQPFTILAYSFYPELGPSRTRGQVSSLGLTGGLDWTIGKDWTVSAFASFARERSRERNDNIHNATALDEATGTLPDDPATAFSTATSGFFNPYGSGSSNSAAILDFIGSGFASLRRRSSIADATLKADGSLIDVWGGALRIAIGGTVRRETFVAGGETFYDGIRPTAIVTPDGHRTIGAVFGEFNMPIVGSRNAVAGLRALTLSAALRHESYSDFGSTTNPKIGVAWSPATGVTLRANWGTSFRAPALIEVNDRRSVSPTQLPNGSGGYTPSILVGGGNPQLGPERATTWSGGVVLQPVPIDGLKIEFGLFSTRFRDRIGQPALQDLLRALTDPTLAPFVERIAPASSAADLARVQALLAEPNASSAGGLPAAAFQAIVDGRYINTGRLAVSGLDGDISLTRHIGADQLDIGLSASWLFHYRVQATPRARTVDRLDTLGNPAAIRVRGSTGWTHGIWSASLFGNWVSAYRNDSVQPIGTIASWFTTDATLTVAPSKGVLQGFRFALNIENVFDAAPPFADRASGIGFDAANASPFGRIVAIELRRAF